MTNIETICLDSNICRYQHAVRQFGHARGYDIQRDGVAVGIGYYYTPVGIPLIFKRLSLITLGIKQLHNKLNKLHKFNKPGVLNKLPNLHLVLSSQFVLTS